MINNLFKDESDKVIHIHHGLVEPARYLPSPHYDERPDREQPSLLVIHNISLPPNQYGGPYIQQLFQGLLDPTQHPYFATIYQLKVSSHCLIRRQGELIQFINLNQRAWHAGQSCFQGRQRCNDFSIGVELEGSDDDPFTEQQYQTLINLTKALMNAYPIALDHIVGHSDISPGRKTDPGPFFDWTSYKQALR